MSLTLDGLVKSLAVITERKNKIFQDLHQAIGAASILEQLVQQLISPPPAAPEEVLPTMDNVEIPNGEANEQGTEQAA
jgi:hypothetical protein